MVYSVRFLTVLPFLIGLLISTSICDGYRPIVYPSDENESGFREIFSWKQIEYDNLPHEYLNMRFGPDNWPYYEQYGNLPTGVTHYKGRIFISVPRRRPGIPSTLNYFKVNSTNKSPKLHGYPNYRMNLLQRNFQPSENTILSVYRTKVDYKCGRLWFVDTGSLDLPTGSRQIQRPALYAIDLNTDNVVVRYEIPESITPGGNGLVTLTIDVIGNDCRNTYVYIPDFRAFRIHVYSVKDNRMWRFAHNSFYVDHRGGNFNIGGYQFMWNDGIFSIALGPPRGHNGYRNAFYHALSSTSEFGVGTEVLRNETLSQRRWHGRDFNFVGDFGEGNDSGISDTDSTNKIIFYARVQQNGVSCWNTMKPFRPNHHVLLETNPNWIYPTDLSIDDKDDIYFMSNQMPAHIFGQLNTNEINFRIMKQSVQNAIRGTQCA